MPPVLATSTAYPPLDRASSAAAWAAAAGVLVLAGLVLLTRSGVNRSGGDTRPPPAVVQAGPLAQGQPAPVRGLRGRAPPGIEQAYRAHRAEGFTVVGVNTLENGDGPAFYHRLQLTFPAAHDPGTPGRIGSAYGVTQGLPASVFVDRAGRVQLIQYGPVTRSVIDALARL